MKIAIIGSRGIPPSYGGFETFTFELALKLAEKGHQITIVNDKINSVKNSYKNITIINSIYNKGVKPLHYYYHSLKLVQQNQDIILVCGVGGSLFYKILNIKTMLITNVDGLEHLRGKYSFWKKSLVYVLQKLSAKHSNFIVADSIAVKNYWMNRFLFVKNKITAIAYGANVPEKTDASILVKFNLEEYNYFLVVARLVPENNIEMILSGFSQYRGLKKLVIVGNVKDTKFSQALSERGNENIVFTDGVYDKPQLDALRNSAFAYIHGHSVGGTNPALLEAMICKCCCICHDNIYNREVTNNEQFYFSSGNSLFDQLNYLEEIKNLDQFKEMAFKQVVNNYSWNKIADEYEKLFFQLIKK